MKKIKLILKLLIFISIFGCDNDPSRKLAEKYDQKSVELLDFITANSTIDCKCILEPSKESIIKINIADMPMQDTMLVKKAMMSELKINRMSELDSMIELSKRFDLSKSIRNASIHIISREGLDTITTHSSYKKWIELVDKKCPDGFCIVDKPIFSNDFKIVQFDMYYGGSCFPNYPIIFEYVNGQWTCEDCY